MIQDTITLPPRKEEVRDIKKLIFLLSRQWHWILLFGFFGLVGGYIWFKLSKPVYTISSSILIPKESKGLDMKELFQGDFTQFKTQIASQMEILKSSLTIGRTLENLRWRTSWYKKNMFVWGGIYRLELFQVKEATGFTNPPNIRIFITPLQGNAYRVNVNGKMNGQDISLESTGQFGSVFSSGYFNFTLLKKGGGFQGGDEFYFTFNDPKQMILDYKSRLRAKLNDESSEIVLLTIDSEEPVKEGDFLNELINVYVAQKMAIQNGAMRQSLDFINSQLSGITDSLNTAGNKFADFRSNNNIIDLGAEGTLVMTNLKEIESERARSQVQLDYFKDVLSYIEKADQLDKLASPSVVGIEDASLNALFVKLGELYSRRQVLAFTAKGNNPTLVLLDKELSETKNRLTENLRNLIQNASKSINSLKERQASISSQLNKLPQKEQKMISIQRQFTLTNEIYTFLLQKRAETNIALASSISDIQVIERAQPETAISVSLPLNKILAVGFILGLILPVGFILLVNFFDSRIRSQEEVEKGTRLPILGHIMHKTEASELSVFNHPKSTIAESFRDLRTNLKFMLTGEGSKVISIHSTNTGEGKSFTSINLGTILSMNDKKVMLIGADMRKPKLHKIFSNENLHGLSTCLIGYDTLDQVIVPTEIENLHLLPAGPVPPNPAEILDRPVMKDILDQLRKQYDYIIIDNAPVAMVTDGFILGELSDLNIFILRYGVSHKHQLDMINQFTESQKIRNVAIVVNDIKANSFGNTYYKYYQYEASKYSYYAEEDPDKKKRRKATVAKSSPDSPERAQK